MGIRIGGLSATPNSKVCPWPGWGREVGRGRDDKRKNGLKKRGHGRRDNYLNDHIEHCGGDERRESKKIQERRTEERKSWGKFYLDKG